MINKISASELSQFLGKSLGWASHLRTGRKKLPLYECLRVSEHFGIPLCDLRKDLPIQKSAPTSLENKHGTR